MASIPFMPMKSSHDFETELAEACKSLETRFRILRIPTFRVFPEQWNSLNPDLRALVPDWLKRILAQHAICNGFLEYADVSEDWTRLFSFYTPEDYEVVLSEDALYRKLLPYGLLPFAVEANGNAWVIENPSRGPEAAIFLCNYSAWDGGEPKAKNGFQFAASRLALLLPWMGVSEAGFENLPITMWYKESPHEGEG